MFIVSLALLHYYTKALGFLAYGGLAVRRIRLSYIDAVCLWMLALLLACQWSMKSPTDLLIDARFFWGWLVFYFIFKGHPPSSEALTRTLVILSVAAILEAVLINTALPPELLPNFPTGEGTESHYAAIGSYQRPYSFGASASVSSAILVALMAFVRARGWRFWLGVIAVLAFVSGSGTMALLALLAVRHRSLFWKAAIPIGALAALAIFYFSDLADTLFSLFSAKTGSVYVNYLLDYKVEQIATTFGNSSGFNLLVGESGKHLAEIGRGGDFGLLSFVATNGLLGLFVLLLITLSRLTNQNRFPITLLLLTTLHYPVIFFIPGQMLFGLLLAEGRRERVRLSQESQGEPRVLGCAAV